MDASWRAPFLLSQSLPQGKHPSLQSPLPPLSGYVVSQMYKQGMLKRCPAYSHIPLWWSVISRIRRWGGYPGETPRNHFPTMRVLFLIFTASNERFLSKKSDVWGGRVDFRSSFTKSENSLHGNPILLFLRWFKAPHGTRLPSLLPPLTV